MGVQEYTVYTARVRSNYFFQQVEAKKKNAHWSVKIGPIRGVGGRRQVVITTANQQKIHSKISYNDRADKQLED